MRTSETIQRLTAVTDEGLFERLATAVLRESNSQYRQLTHPGVNADGKTVKSPVDGIMFLPGADPPHMIAVHHTTCKRADLEKKWLLDPVTVTPRKGHPTAPAGDVVKAIGVYHEQRKKTPALRGTLILTTNEEPPEALVREVNAVGSAAGLAVEIWSRSALAHFLDYEPKGQWIRQTFFGIQQERISPELLTALSRRSLELNRPSGDEEAWVDRGLDERIAQASGQDVVFVVAESGFGKSVACYKRLHRHVEAGGFGIVLPHEIVAASPSFDHALEAALRQLHPPLAAGSGSVARALSSEHAPLLVVVEDINKSGQPALLLEKISGWGAQRKDDKQASSSQILCPVWPRIIGSLGEEARRRISSLSVEGQRFSASEGADAVQRRRERAGAAVTRLEAETISSALGHDPLLIALHDPGAPPDPANAVSQFVEGSLARLAAVRSEFTPGEYRGALTRLATAMLKHRRLDPAMMDVATWLDDESDTVRMIRHIAQSGEVVRLAGVGSDERLAFRHDRVRDFLLADAAAGLMRGPKENESILTEPYFAEVIGAALAFNDVPIDVIDTVRALNPLALFHAARNFGEPQNDAQRAVLSACQTWLEAEGTLARDKDNLRWQALRALSETEASYVTSLVKKFKAPGGHWALWARFRNGDIAAGIDLCRRHDLGGRLVGFNALMEYARRHYLSSAIEVLGRLLRDPELPQSVRSGALRLAGYLGDPGFTDAIEASWKSDGQRGENLADYLFAAAECGGDNPARLLEPICDAWAALSDVKTEPHVSSPRNALAAHGVRDGFHYRLPEATVRYFIARAAQPELRWPLTYVLHGLDHPTAVEFIVRDLAATDELLEGTKQFSPFSMTARTEWTRRQDYGGRVMSAASRDRLRQLWEDKGENKFVRRHAFGLWTATVQSGDLQVLRTVPASDLLADAVLRARLVRRDREAIPLLIAKLPVDEYGSWWQYGRYVWLDGLMAAFEKELTARGLRNEPAWNFKDTESRDWIISELMMGLPTRAAETLLLKHWEHLRFSPYFIQAALHVSSQSLRERVAKAVAECPEPKALFEHLTIHFGFKVADHPGVTRLAQIEGLLPYLDYLKDMAIHDLWDACNDHGWFDFRRRYIDPHLKEDRMDMRYTEYGAATKELDKNVAEGRSHWGDLWVDRFIKSGASVDHVMSVVRAWLADQTSITALDLAGNIVVHAGHRRHLEILTAYAAGPVDAATAIVANASYALKRRTLS